MFYKCYKLDNTFLVFKRLLNIPRNLENVKIDKEEYFADKEVLIFLKSLISYNFSDTASRMARTTLHTCKNYDR